MGDGGGGIYNGFATLTITDSTFSGNTASDGGGIFNYGALTIADSNFSGNTFDDGGGIFNDGGTLTVSDSTVSGNSAAFYGGSIFNHGYGTATLTDITISGNSATYGGGIANDYGTATVTDCTISGNSARVSGGGCITATSGTDDRHTIIVGNTSPDRARRRGRCHIVGQQPGRARPTAARALAGARLGGTDLTGTAADPLTPTWGRWPTTAGRPRRSRSCRAALGSRPAPCSWSPPAVGR